MAGLEKWSSHNKAFLKKKKKIGRERVKVSYQNN